MRKPRSLRASCAGVVLLLAMAVEARAGEASRIVLVREKESDAFLDEAHLRVASELRSAGFDVRERAAPPQKDPRKQVEGDGVGSSAAVATILLRKIDRTTTDIWIADHLTHKTVLRKIDSHDDPATLAMLVLELMRASMIEPFALESRAKTKPPEDVTRFVSPFVPSAATASPVRKPRVFLDVGVGMLWGDLGLAIAPVLSLAIPTGPFRLGVFAMAPAFGAIVRKEQGVAHIRQELALAEIAWSPTTSTWFRPRASMGVGAYHVRAEGDARDPYRDGQDGAWAFLTSVGVGGSVALSRTARVVLEGRALVGFPQPVIRFASERAASALRPSFAITTALEVDL